jgi:ABC-type glycerol-3-phosphate transport system permease component
MTQTRKRSSTRIRASLGDRIFGVINGFVMVLLSAVTLIPVLSVFLLSLTPTADIQNNPNAFIVMPSYITFNNYLWLFRGSSKLLDAYVITILRTVIGTAACLLVTALTAYPLSKKYLPGRNTIMKIFFFTMIFSGGLIPTYLVVHNIGLTNTFWSMIFPPLMSVYYMMIMRTFFQSIPDELDESARIDGANDIVILFRIVLPLALPTMASIGLFYAVFHWNSFMDAIIYLGGTGSRGLWPLQMLMREIVITNDIGELQLGGLIQDPRRPGALVLISCTVAVSVLPIMCLYPFLQRYFVKGLMVGAVKG